MIQSREEELRGLYWNATAEARGKKTAVVCDDDYILAHILRHILEKLGFTVYEAGNGEEGLGLIRSRKPSLVLLDLDMPVKDGIEVLESLGRPGAARTYVIVLSNHQKRQDEVMALGAREALIKPLESAPFGRKIEGLVRGGEI